MSDEQAEQAAAPAARRGKAKLILIIGAALLMLAGGGAAAYFALIMPAGAPADAAQAELAHEDIVFVDLPELLVNLNVSGRRLHFLKLAAALEVAGEDQAAIVPAFITVHFEGKTHKVPYRKGLSILNAAREAGLSPNSACEEGFCASCAAKKIKGTIVLANNDIYTEDDLASGWILTCQGHAFGEEVEITYDVV